jgi:hypothetical protein
VSGHVHGDDVSSWSAGQMLEHLRTEHRFRAPMFWNAGRLHTEHLKFHMTARETAVPANPNQSIPTVQSLAEPRVNQENPQVRKDRIICALAGIDFESIFVRDASSNLRGALRTAYDSPARHLLYALDRGELADLMVPAERFRKEVDQLDEAIRDRDEARRIVEHAWQKLEQAHGTCTEAHLGLATTRELLDELTARIEAGHGGLDYRTVDEDPEIGRG